MKTAKILVILLLLSTSSTMYAKEENCEAGGVGSISCVVEKTFSVDVAFAASGETVKYEVTCGEGYYSCCNLNMFTGAGSANCHPAPKLASE